MPILSPKQIQEVKRELQPTAARPTEGFDLSALLKEKNLAPEQVLEQVQMLMVFGETGSIQLGAAKIAAELNGLLKKDMVAAPIPVIINIVDSGFVGINPILIPRTT